MEFFPGGKWVNGRRSQGIGSHGIDDILSPWPAHWAAPLCRGLCEMSDRGMGQFIIQGVTIDGIDQPKPQQHKKTETLFLCLLLSHMIFPRCFHNSIFVDVMWYQNHIILQRPSHLQCMFIGRLKLWCTFTWIHFFPSLALALDDPRRWDQWLPLGIYNKIEIKIVIFTIKEPNYIWKSMLITYWLIYCE